MFLPAFDPPADEGFVFEVGPGRDGGAGEAHHLPQREAAEAVGDDDPQSRRYAQQFAQPLAHTQGVRVGELVETIQ